MFENNQSNSAPVERSVGSSLFQESLSSALVNGSLSNQLNTENRRVELLSHGVLNFPPLSELLNRSPVRPADLIPHSQDSLPNQIPVRPADQSPRGLDSNPSRSHSDNQVRPPVQLSPGDTKILPGNERRSEILDILKKMEEARKGEESIKRFKDRWTESTKSLGLDKGPLGPILKELGEQIVSGKLDPEKIKKLMKDVKIPDEDMRVLNLLLQEFNKEMVDQFGTYFSFTFDHDPRSKSANLRSVGIILEDKPTTLFFGEDGLQAHSVYDGGCFGRPSRTVLTTKEAMERFHDLIKTHKPPVRFP